MSFSEEENEEEVEEKHNFNTNYRWLALFTVMATSGGNAMGWLAFAPIPGPTTEYFGISTNQVDLFSVLFMLVGIPVGLVAIWCVDIIGLRKSIWIAASFNLAGSAVRLSTLFHEELDAEDNFLAAPKWCYPVALVGTAIMAVSQAFILVIPTKMASQWFQGDQRLLANSLSSLSNPLGMMIAAVTAPIIVKSPSDLWIQALIFVFPVLLGLLCSFFIPGEGNYPSGKAEELSLKQRLKYLFKEYRREYILILLVGAIGIAHFSTKLTLLVQFLCPGGYDNTFSSSICASAIIVSGIVFSAILSVFIDGKEFHSPAAKILLFIALGASIGFSFMMHTPEIKPWIALVLGIYGLGGLSFFPLCCEMAAESTFPCGEATSTGFMMMLGQLLAAAMMFGSVAVPQGFVPEASVCNPKEEAQDLSDFSLYLDLVIFGLWFLFAFMYKCSYRRKHYYEELAEDSSQTTSL